MNSGNSAQQPHSRHPHIFVIIRADFPLDVTDPMVKITTTKAFTDERYAADEVARLNELQKDKNCKYEYRICRLVEKSESGADEKP